MIHIHDTGPQLDTKTDMNDFMRATPKSDPYDEPWVGWLFAFMVGFMLCAFLASGCSKPEPTAEQIEAIRAFSGDSAVIGPMPPSWHNDLPTLDIEQFCLWQLELLDAHEAALVDWRNDDHVCRLRQRLHAAINFSSDEMILELTMRYLARRRAEVLCVMDEPVSALDALKGTP